MLIEKAKKEYYRSKAEGRRNHNPSRWYKDIFQLAGFVTDSNMVNCTSEQATNTVELLQDIFTIPWKDLHMTTVPSLADVASLLSCERTPLPFHLLVKLRLH